MFWHPLHLAITAVDIVAALLMLVAATSAFRAAAGWRPTAADRRQMALEAEMESAAILGRWVRGLLLFSFFLLVFGIANLYPETISGAMCGTGVLQAMNTGGRKMLLFRLLLLLLLQLWFELDALNRVQAEAPLTETAARMFLAIPPVAALALFQTHDAFAGLDPYRPVDCCAAVYDRFRSLQQAETLFGIGDGWWVTVFGVLSLLVIGLSVAVRFSANRRRRFRAGLAAASLLWLPVAALTLVRVLSAYHYGVLHHHCPWCLFLPEHNLVGYPLYGAMAVIGMEGMVVVALPRLVASHRRSSTLAAERCRRAGMRMIAAMAIFLMLSVLPAIVWRLRYGVWMGG